MAACGALFANDGKADMRIKKALRSELRQQIFRQFVRVLIFLYQHIIYGFITDPATGR